MSSEAEFDAMKARWAEVNRIFHQAVELSVEERERYLQSVTGFDPEMDAEVRALLTADRDASSYLEESPLSGSLQINAGEPPLQPDDILCDRFRILRPIAGGGMGYVFEALDQELNVRIALKTIRPEIAGASETLARFRQEVRLARTITHPNVCRTFDLDRDTLLDAATGRSTSIVFLTMELLAGETLASLIERQGKLAQSDVLPLARQIAYGLAAAHALGIVHRDMKPANVMLVPVEGSETLRAVITDFGLARLNPNASHSGFLSSASVSSSSAMPRLVGTLAYMAPEQLNLAPVSPATDIYTFGLVLFEMLTGRQAFPADDIISGLTLRLKGGSSSALQLTSDLPSPWLQTIRQCLETDPRHRPSSVLEVVAMIEGRPSLRFAVRRASFSLARVRWLSPITASFVLVAILVLMSLFVLASRYRQTSGECPVNSGCLVYLTPVTNHTGEAWLDHVSDLVAAGLAQSVQINLLDPVRIGDILQQMTKSPDTPLTPPIAREIAMRAGAVRVAFTSITGSHGRYTLELKLEQLDNTPAKARNVWRQDFPFRTTISAASGTTLPSELLSAVRDASDWIRHKAGESPEDIARLDVPPEDVTTSNWHALASYAAANRAYAHGQPEAAIGLLQTAVQADPAFALAYARMGDILVSAGDAEKAYEAYLNALDERSRQTLTLRERDRIQGNYALDTRDFPRAIQAFREYSSLYPKDWLGWFYQSYPLMMLGRGAQAIESMERAARINPASTGAPEELALNSLVLGNLADAERWNALLAAHTPGRAQVVEARIRFASGDFTAAEHLFSSLPADADFDSRINAVRGLANLHADRGEFHVALALIEKAAALDPSNKSLALDRADLYGRLSDTPRCIDEVESLLHEHAGLDTVLDASRVLGRAYQTAPFRHRPLIVAELRRLEGRVPSQAFGNITDLVRARISGERLLAEGRPANALRELRKAATLDAVLPSRDYLSRALTTLASQTKSPGDAANRLRLQAMSAVEPVALHSTPVWQWQEYYPPGFYADQLDAWLDLARKTGRNDITVQQAAERLRNLRSHA